MTAGILSAFTGARNGGLVFQLDAGNSSSYSGSGQTFANIIGDPKDGRNQIDYDFWLGGDNTSSNDPVFNGSAGVATASTYFTPNNADQEGFFLLKGGNTDFINSIHQANAIYTQVYWIRTGVIGDAHTLAGTVSGSNSISFTLQITGSADLSFSIARDSGVSVLGAMFGSGVISSNTLCMLAVSIDSTIGAGGGLLYKRDSTKTTHSFNSTYTSPSSAAAASTLEICGLGFSSGNNPEGFRFYQALFYNKALTTSELDDVFDTYKGRYGL